MFADLQRKLLTRTTATCFLHCCADVTRVGRFLVVNAGLSAQDRATLHKRYRFLESTESEPSLAQLRREIGGRYWLHLGPDWRFFAPEKLIGRLIAVLEAEPEAFQVGINLSDADKLTGVSASEDMVRRAPDAGRYVLTEVTASGPAMVDTARLDRRKTASLDEVLCIAAH